LFNPGRKESLFIVPGDLAVILGLYPAILSAICIVREKEEGNIIQIYAVNIQASEFLLGKWLAYLFIGMSEAVFTIGMAIIIFHLKLAGDPLLFFVGTELYIAETVMCGLMVGVFARTQSAAIQLVGTTRSMFVLLLSGFIYPLSNIPFPISLLSYLVSTRYYVELIRDTFVRGGGWVGTWYLLPMIFILFLVQYIITWHRIRPMQITSR